MLFLSFLDPVKNEISNKITFARPGVSVFGALHCMSCSSCLLSAKILHMQIHMLHLGSGCMLVQQVRLPHFLASQSVTGGGQPHWCRNGYIFPKGWPDSAVCLGISRAGCRAGEQLGEWHVLRECRSGGNCART